MDALAEAMGRQVDDAMARIREASDDQLSEWMAGPDSNFRVLVGGEMHRRAGMRSAARNLARDSEEGSDA